MIMKEVKRIEVFAGSEVSMAVYASDYDALLAELDDLKRDAERRIPLYEAAERACRDLPNGWNIKLCLERGAGWIELYDDCGEYCDGFPTNNERLDYTLNDAIDAALQARQ
jgi:hypothetical protein